MLQSENAVDSKGEIIFCIGNSHDFSCPKSKTDQEGMSANSARHDMYATPQSHNLSDC